MLVSVVWMNKKGIEFKKALLFGASFTCLELRGVHCEACWPGRTAPPGEDRCLEGSGKEDAGSEDSGGDGRGGCRDLWCCCLLMSTAIQCRRKCGPRLSWRCGWRHLGSLRTLSLLPASHGVPASWPVFCQEHNEGEMSGRSSELVCTNTTKKSQINGIIF